MDQDNGNDSLPEMGKEEDSTDCHESPHNSPRRTQQPSGGEGNVSTSRGLLLLSLALSGALLAVLGGVLLLHSNALTKLYVIGEIHKDLSASLNRTGPLLKNGSATLNITDFAETINALIYKHNNLATLLRSIHDADLIAKVNEVVVKHNYLVTVLGSFNAASGCRVCPHGWAHNSGKCYLFSSTRKTWSQSRDHCITLGGHLAIVNSQEEQNFLSQRAIEDFYWMGLSDLETEGQWIWVDSTPLSETGAVSWGKRSVGQDEPDNWKEEDSSGENCAGFTKSGHWMDGSCKNLRTFVCETVATN